MLHPERGTAHVYTPDDDQPPALGMDDELIPGPFLPGFSVTVGDLLRV